MDDHAGVLLMVISVLTSYFTWYLCRSNSVDFLRCGHVESDNIHEDLIKVIPFRMGSIARLLLKR